MSRAGLAREGILAAALRIADAEGLAGLSMRRLAAELGVEAMSLYHHVPNKRKLLEGIVDEVWGLVDLAEQEGDWRVALHRLCGSAHRAMLAHPWFFSLPVTYGGVHRLHVIDATLGHMRRAGVGAEAAYHALHVLDGHVYGYSWQDIGYADVDELDARAEEMLAQVTSDDLPWLLEHARQHMGATPAGDGFAVGLDLILDGIAGGRLGPREGEADSHGSSRPPQ